MAPARAGLAPLAECQAGGTRVSLLTVEHLTIRFGGLVAIDDVSFAAEDRRITAIIGPNGAGKTTVFNCLTGFYKPDVGRMCVAADGQEWLLERMEGFRIARDAGIARTFQNIRLFPKMTVLENLLVAQHKTLQRASLFSLAGLVGAKSFRLAEEAAIERARGWLARCNLVHVADDEAGSLPYGAQRRLEIARAMCTGPRILCLDEPAAGLNPAESSELAALVRSIRDDEKIAVLLIEHDMSVVMEISDQIIVLDHGRKIAQGRPDEIRANPDVIRAYLGTDEEAAATP